MTVGGKYRKYRNSALVSYHVADTIDNLLYAGYVGTDVDAAARCVPLLFHPQQDAVLFEGDRRWWRAGHDERQHAAQRVQNKFDGWYGAQATPVQKAYLTMVGLMTNHEIIDQVVDNAVELLGDRHQIQMVDADDSLFYVNDYAGMRHGANIDAVLDLPEYQTPVIMLQKQIQRIIEAPAVDLTTIENWQKENGEYQDKIYEYHYRNVFARTNVTPKRARKVLARSYELLQRFIGLEQARKFIHGEELLIRGQHVVWGLVLKTDKIIELTVDPSRHHTPFVISIYDHDSRKLCNGCVLWPGTPALDQAVAFLLATADPEEELELLNQTNLSRVTEVGRVHPLLAARCERDPYLTRSIIDLRQEEEGLVIEAVPVEPVAALTLADGEVLDIDAPDFDQRFYTSIAERNQRRRQERLHNEILQRVERAFLARIDAPPPLINLMMQPEHLYWNRHNIGKTLPANIAHYVTTKQLH